MEPAAFTPSATPLWKAFTDEMATRIQTAIAGGHVPEQDATLAAPALVGALLEGLIGPLAPQIADDPVKTHAAVQMLTLLALRALGVVDARARGIVVQTVIPTNEETAA